MPTVNEAVADAIRQYPTLFRCRTDVLHHYFCVIGNGYEWVNGELVSDSNESLKGVLLEWWDDVYTSDEDWSGWPNFAKNVFLLRGLKDRLVYWYEQRRPLSTILTDEKKELAREAKYAPEPGDSAEEHARYKARLAKIRTRVRRENMELRFTVENADDLALVAWRDAEPIYPLCQYAKILTVPDDVKPDWLAAVREMIFAVFYSPVRKPEGDRTVEICTKEHASNIEFASKVLTSLHERFGSANGQVTSYEEYQERRAANRTALSEMLRSVLEKDE